MSKIICEICGTKYPDTAEQCPICGYTNGFAEKTEAEETVIEEVLEETAPKARGGLFSKSGKRNHVEEEEDEFDEDEDEYEDDEEEYEDDEDDDDDDEEDDEDDEKPSVLLNVLLVIVILALLCVSGFIFAKYFLPNVVGDKEVAPPTEPYVQTDAPVTEEPTVPCAELVLEETDLVLDEVGQMYLLNVAVSPADTTDILSFASSDESVVTVNEEGRLTVTGEGSAVVTIACGAQEIRCNVEVILPEETEEPTEEPTEAPTEEPTEEPTEALKDVKLEINGNTDVTFRGIGLTFTFRLKNGLTNEEVTWESENEKICVVDESGNMVTKGWGTTNVIVTYGDQQVKIIVRVPRN